MKILKSGTAVFSRPETGRGSCCFAIPCVLPGGRWLVSYREGQDKESFEQSVKLTWSDDQGATWREPVEPFTAVPLIEGRPGVFRGMACTALDARHVIAILYWLDASDTSRPFFDRETESLLDSHLMLAESSDAGETWTTPRRVEPPCYPDHAKPITGPLLCMPDGRWACQFELNKRYGDPRPWVHKPVLVFSSDRGRTWPEHAVPACDPANHVFYWDQRPGVMPDGSVLDLFWAYDLVSASYRNIHASLSSDGGRTWTPPWDTGVAGQPAPPVALPDGRRLMVFVDRTGAPAIKWRTSGDGGRTWPRETEQVIFDSRAQAQVGGKDSTAQAWNEMVEFSVGLPQTAPLPDGRVLVTYYAGGNVRKTDIQWALLGR